MKKILALVLAMALLCASAAALAEVDCYGLVRNVCGAPTFDKPGVAPEGQAFHILMEAARNQLRTSN